MAVRKVVRSKKPKTRTVKPSRNMRLKLSILIGGVLVIFAAWYGLRSMSAPVEINQVISGAESAISRYPVASNGCVQEQVQCVQAPCPPVWKCPAGVTPPPTSTSTTIPASCTSWFDGCNTCTVENGVIKACTKMACKAQTEAAKCVAYGKESTAPVPSCIPQPRCPEGKACPAVIDPRYCIPGATSTPTPKPSDGGGVTGGINTFEATGPCGSDSYKSYTFTCKNGSKIGVAFASCTSISSAMTQVQQACGVK